MNEILNLQLFAEGAGEQTEETGAQEPGKAPVSGSEKLFTQEQVDQMISQRMARERAKSDKEAQKKANEAAEAEKLKNMSEAERTAQKIADLEKQLNAFQNEKTQNQMMAAARSELRARGYNLSDAIVSRLIGEDAEATKSAIDDFAAEFDKAVEKAVKERVPSTAPKAGTKKSTMTKQEIMAVKNKVERQRLIKANIHLFK